ncbi:MAG: hypothetical protein AAGF07_05550 [Patescibacteria group bacterium]
MKLKLFTIASLQVVQLLIPNIASAETKICKKIAGQQLCVGDMFLDDRIVRDYQIPEKVKVYRRVFEIVGSANDPKFYVEYRGKYIYSDTTTCYEWDPGLGQSCTFLPNLN